MTQMTQMGAAEWIPEPHELQGHPSEVGSEGVVVAPTIGPSTSAKSAASADFRAGCAAALYDYGARFYDPQLVQFVSQDPVREYVQAYAYVGWNPVRYTDPTGMLTVPDAGGASGLNFALGFPISGPVALVPTVPEVIRAADYATALRARGPGHGGKNGPAGGLPSIPDLAAFLETGGLDPPGATAGAEFYTHIGLETVASSSVASLPGASGPLSALGAASRGDTGVAAVLGDIGVAKAAAAEGLAVASMFGGYIDINVTAGYLLGATGGVMFASEGYYPYAGGSLTSPPGSVSVSASPFAASPGWAVAVQITTPTLIVVQVGYGIGAWPFVEVGIGGPRGISGTAFHAWGPVRY
ncbi:hypothetical protein L6Q96_05800 [Candidatus Binatia bacterium]|nr:hypothetical protein [Candidatus Binatia bacterium]